MLKKQIITISIIVFLALLMVLGTLSLKGFKHNSIDYVNTIEQEIALINAHNSYDMRVFSAEEFLDHVPDGGGSLTAYSEKEGKVKKIRVEIGLSMGNISSEYFFNDQEELIAVYETEESFTFDQKLETLDYAQVVATFEGTYYFDSNNLIAQEIVGERKPDDAPDRQATLLLRAQEYKDLIKK